MTSAWKHPLFAALVPLLSSLACGSGGGAAGSEGPGVCQEMAATGSSPLIDDLNDGDEHILSNEGRQGTWYVYNDGTGTQTPTPRPPKTCGTDWSFPVTDGQACTHGSAFTKYGAAVGVTLNATPGNCKSCNYDASVYKGVRFTISGDVPGGTVNLRVNTADSMNVLYGGTCSDDAACGDAYCANVNVSSTPQTVEIPWTQLRQQGWGTKATFDLRRLFNLAWQTQPGGGAAFSFCVDDVSFF